MSDVEINPPDFETRLAEAYASKSQMVRDTDDGLRYLVPDPADAGRARRRGEAVAARASSAWRAPSTRRRHRLPASRCSASSTSTSTCSGRTSSSRSSSPARCSSPTTPTRRFCGSRFDLGRRRLRRRHPVHARRPIATAQEVTAEKIKHLPEHLPGQHRASPRPVPQGVARHLREVGQLPARPGHRPDFVTPVDTITNGAELRLNWNQSGLQHRDRLAATTRARSGSSGATRRPRATTRSQKDYWSRWSVDQGLLLRRSSASCTSSWRTWTARTSTASRSASSARSRTTRCTGFQSGSVRADRACGRQPLLRNQHREHHPFRGHLRPGARHGQALRLPQHATSPAPACWRRSTAPGTTRGSAPRSACRWSATE